MICLSPIDGFLTRPHWGVFKRFEGSFVCGLLLLPGCFCSWLLASGFGLLPFALCSLLSAFSSLPFVFPKKLVTFKPLKNQNETAYVTMFKKTAATAKTATIRWLPNPGNMKKEYYNLG